MNIKSGRNIFDPLYDLTKAINDALASNNQVLVTFPDLAKAFNSLERSNLLNKMSSIRVRGNALTWFQEY